LLGAFQNNLYTVAFRFLCHDNLIDAIINSV